MFCAQQEIDGGIYALLQQKCTYVLHKYHPHRAYPPKPATAIGIKSRTDGPYKMTATVIDIKYT